VNRKYELGIFKVDTSCSMRRKGKKSGTLRQRHHLIPMPSLSPSE